MLCENATLGGNGKLWQIANLYKSNLALTGIRFLSLLNIQIISPTFLHTTYVTSSIKVIIKAYTFHLNGLCLHHFFATHVQINVQISVHATVRAPSSTVQHRKWSPTADDPETTNDLQNGPQMILDRKWSRKKIRSDLDSSKWIIVLILLLLQ